MRNTMRPDGRFCLDTSGLLANNHAFPGSYDFDGFFASLPLKYFPRASAGFPVSRDPHFNF